MSSQVIGERDTVKKSHFLATGLLFSFFEHLRRLAKERGAMLMKCRRKRRGLSNQVIDEKSAKSGNIQFHLLPTGFLPSFFCDKGEGCR